MKWRKLSFWIVAGILAAGAVFVSYGAAVNAGHSKGWGVALAGFAAGMLSVWLTAATTVAFDYFVLDSFDLLTELKNGNVAVAIAFAGLLVASALSFPVG